MKAKLGMLLGVSLIASVFVCGNIFAHEEDEVTTQDTAQTQTTDTPTETDEERRAKLRERLEKRKTERNMRLTTAEEQRVKNRCKAAQGKISALSGHLKGVETSRTKVHSNVTEHLTKASDKLKVAGLDTATLDGQIAELKAKITTFQTELTEYKQVVADLAEMDCEADPEAFRASLAEARTARGEAHAVAKEVRDYLKDNIKLTLQSLRVQLSSSTAEGEN